MESLLTWLALSVFIFIILLFTLYLLLELRMLWIARKVEKRKLTHITGRSNDKEDNNFKPKVSVLLPVYNEGLVVERLIDAVYKLCYPQEQLEILVLDDSVDKTSKLIKNKVAAYVKKGINIRRVTRPNRKGYKAGNLMNGIQLAKGDFFVIFDADFIPPENFLLETLPHFANEKLGYLQTGIGYENRDASFLTQFQAMEMSHQQYVTVGLSEDGNMVSLSGSSCVWRRACVEALGGWQATTITEDVDLGYRAQFDAWEYAYLPDVVSLSILPSSISAFRVQRERWSRGLIHSGLKHAKNLFQQSMPLMRRLHAMAMMFSAVLLALIYLLVLLTLPLSYWVDFNKLNLWWVTPAFFSLVTVWALGNSFGAYKNTKQVSRPNIIRVLWQSYLYVALFIPMSWYYFVGGIRALLGVHGEFNRTPKDLENKKYKAPPINRFLLWGEFFTFFYSCLAITVALINQNYFLLLMNITVCVGFGMVLYWEWLEGKNAKR